MTRLWHIALVGLFIGTVAGADPDGSRVESGGDTFLSGSLIDETLDATGDAFVAARTVVVNGRAGGDLHASGFDVTVNARATEDLYAFGASVLVQSQVAEDLTAGGLSVRTSKASEIDGNARLFARKVTIEGPVAGALIVAALDVILNAEIAGDARIAAQSISFGPDAKVGGTLTYGTRDRISVPERVAPADRVMFERVTPSEARARWRDLRDELPGPPRFASVLFGFLVSLLFFVALGALMLAIMPRRLSKMRRGIAEAPGQSILLGIIGLSMLFGMVPITGLTIIGLPLVPVVILLIIVAWMLGYALGAYSVAMRIWIGFRGEDDPSRVTRLLVLAAAITFVALLNFIPFVGWVANYTLVLLGLGAITNAVFHALVGNPGDALDIDMKPVNDRD